MNYRGDIRLGATLDVKFTTRRFTTGAPFTLAGVPAVAAYVGNGTTEITAGITLTVDFDGRTGLNNVRVVATSGNGFASGTDVQLVLSSGTVDGVSVAGEVIAEFSIENRPMTAHNLATQAKSDVNAEVDTALDTPFPGIVTSGSLNAALKGNVPQTGDAFVRIGATGSGLTSLASASALSALSAVFTGITSLGQWLGLIAGKQVGDATARTELRATGAGSGTFDETTDSQEAIRDRGDAAWTTANVSGLASQASLDVVDGIVDAILVDTGTDIPALLSTIASYIDTEIAAIKAKTDNLPTDPADQSSVEAAITAATSPLATQASVDVIDGLVDAIKAKTDALPASPAAVGSEMTLTSGERDAVAAALLDLAAGVETNRTLRQALRLILASAVGKLSGAGGTNVKIRDTNDSKDRIDATVDASGNRTAVTLDAT